MALSVSDMDNTLFNRAYTGSRLQRVITASQQSYGMVMFSVMSVCSGGGLPSPSPTPPTCSNLFDLELAVQGIPRSLRDFRVFIMNHTTVRGSHPTGMLSCLIHRTVLITSSTHCNRTYLTTMSIKSVRNNRIRCKRIPVYVVVIKRGPKYTTCYRPQTKFGAR